MAGERDVLAEALDNAGLVVLLQNPVGADRPIALGHAADLLLAAVAARGYTLSRSEPDRTVAEVVAALERADASVRAVAPSPEPLPLDVERLGLAWLASDLAKRDADFVEAMLLDVEYLCEEHGQNAILLDDLRVVARELLASRATERKALDVERLARAVLAARSETPKWKGLARATEPTPWDKTMARRILAALEKTSPPICGAATDAGPCVLVPHHPWPRAALSEPREPDRPT